eukprot:9493810-Pyramimonas_sp.AAC.1
MLYAASASGAVGSYYLNVYPYNTLLLLVMTSALSSFVSCITYHVLLIATISAITSLIDTREVKREDVVRRLHKRGVCTSRLLRCLYVTSLLHERLFHPLTVLSLARSLDPSGTTIGWGTR